MSYPQKVVSDDGQQSLRDASEEATVTAEE
jgi:hypothetical protein